MATAEVSADDIVLDFGAQRVFLVLSEMMIDDDAAGESQGDGDGVIEFGETIELGLTLENLGQLDAFAVTGMLTTSSPYVGLMRASVLFGDIAHGTAAAAQQPCVFHVTHDVPDGEILTFDLAVSEEPHHLTLAQEVSAPRYRVGTGEIDDGAGGNGIADPGETVSFALRLDNSGGSATPDLVGELQSETSWFAPESTPRPLGVLPAGGGITVEGLGVAIDPACPPVVTANLRLVLTGPGGYVASVPFAFPVGRIFADDMEAGAPSWTHHAGPGNWNDPWHLESWRNHTLAGQTSWKCGGPGISSYGANVYALLETPPIDLPAGARLEFWPWMKAEVSEVYPGYCFDGGLLEISPDGGASWAPLTPDGGYPYRIRASSSAGPFPGETPVWSGQHGWTEVAVDLAAHAGPAQLRWAFGSNGSNHREGWYLDDVRVILPPTSSAGEADATCALRLSAVPSVLTGDVALLKLVSPPGHGPSGATGLVVVDAAGRRVRVLTPIRRETGLSLWSWDGRDAGGRPVAAGAYFCHVAGEPAAVRRLVVVR